MKLQTKRLSILSQTEVQEVYRIPQFSERDREQFFDFTDDELATVRRLHTHRNRIHFLLMLGYFKFKPVWGLVHIPCLKRQTDSPS